MSREGYNYKRFAIKAAIDLCYPKETINQLEKAKTESEIARIMRNARG
jgi:hypothetical protein